MKHQMVTRAIVSTAILGILPAVSHSQGQIAFSTGDLVFKGDLRYRHEYIKQEDTDQRDRQRLRARLNMTATVDKSVNFIFALASGSTDDPVSSNQDLTGGFSDKPVWIGRSEEYRIVRGYHCGRQLLRLCEQQGICHIL